MNPTAQRPAVDGKFFRLGAQKFFVKGITYGPFAPNAAGEMFASPEQTRGDLEQVRNLGANVLRLYYVPPRWFLDLAQEFGLKLLIDIPWPKHLCFLESYDVQQEARQAVRDAVRQCQGHPAVFAYSVVNEIPAEIVRWSGTPKIADFIDELIKEAKAIDPEVLCTFASYPPTEFLAARNIDFVCFNVYLHQPASFQKYLARLQTLAGAKPLLLGEFGIDSIREGEDHKCELLRTQIELACRGGLAGTVVYSFTDDWYRGGKQVEDWAFGLTTREREPKKSFHEVRKLYASAPCMPLPRVPKVSVVVASYNGAKTLDACLSSLQRLNYPDYEVILVDDGSKDNTPEIAARYPKVRNIRQPNKGLSAARNAGINASTGEIVAFTDSDCRADEDWLYYLVSDLIRGNFTGIGGHNFLPPEDQWVAAAVLVSPGGPAHVMLTDEEAEHVPGCNMAFYKWALDEIKGFDPVFRKAGDDVDVCWRLQERGYKIGFSAAGFVWHYRRSTVNAYLKQQAGYGEAEALLMGKHPEKFNAVGGGLWHGRIYAPSKYALLLQPNVVYHGVFGSGFFQKLYASAPAHALMLCTSLEFHCIVTLPLFLLSITFPILLSLAFAALAISTGICAAAAVQADLPSAKKRFWSRPLVATLFFIQPIVRGWARHTTRLHLRFKPGHTAVESRVPRHRFALAQVAFWSRKGIDRFEFLRRILHLFEEHNLETVLDSGWDKFDVAIFRNHWTRLTITTASEYLSENRIFLRCRFEAKWSPLARTFFGLSLAGAAFLIYHFAEVQPWIWMLAPVLTMIAWFFDDERRHTHALVAGLVDEAAAQLQLEPYDAASTASEPSSEAVAAPA